MANGIVVGLATFDPRGVRICSRRHLEVFISANALPRPQNHRIVLVLSHRIQVRDTEEPVARHRLLLLVLRVLDHQPEQPNQVVWAVDDSARNQLVEQQVVNLLCVKGFVGW